MDALLTDEQVDDDLAGTDWCRVGNTVVLDTEQSDFKAAWAFATAVADAAEAANHHPDILVHGWNKVTVTLSTHSAGGITGLDVSLALVIAGLRA